MITLDPDSEKVLNFLYQNIASTIGIGVNQIKEHFQLNNERIMVIIDQLERENFISTNPNYPKGTLSPNAPKNFTPGQLYSITERGINYLKNKENLKNLSQIFLLKQ